MSEPKVHLHAGGPCSLEEFAERHGLQLCIHERPRSITDQLPGVERWYAYFKDVEVKELGFLIGKAGNGDTPADAVCDYARKIAGQSLARWASTQAREDFEAPNKWSSIGYGYDEESGGTERERIARNIEALGCRCVAADGHRSTGHDVENDGCPLSIAAAIWEGRL